MNRNDRTTAGVITEPRPALTSPGFFKCPDCRSQPAGNALCIRNIYLWPVAGAPAQAMRKQFPDPHARRLQEEATTYRHSGRRGAALNANRHSDMHQRVCQSATNSVANCACM